MSEARVGGKGIRSGAEGGTRRNGHGHTRAIGAPAGGQRGGEQNAERESGNAEQIIGGRAAVPLSAFRLPRSHMADTLLPTRLCRCDAVPASTQMCTS